MNSAFARLTNNAALLVAALLSSSAFAADPFNLHPSPLPAERPPFKVEISAKDARSYRAWKMSLAPVIAAQALDIASSRGLRERNPVLANANGQMGIQGSLIKAGIAGTMLGIEYLVIRKHPRAAKLLWKMNLVSAGVTGATAAHNFSLK